MSRDRDLSQRTIWLAGLAVAAGAAALTAHGLYEVARHADVPAAVAWLYPLITDGLALVAYASTAKLTGSGRKWAAGIVILAAGLSGLAQAVYLAGGIGQVEPATLRFGVGYWPAVACALVAHLVHLVGRRPAVADRLDAIPADIPASRPEVSQASRPEVGQPGVYTVAPNTSAKPAAGAGPAVTRAGARERATRAALAYEQQHHGQSPTQRALAELANVSRDIAGQVLRELKGNNTSARATASTSNRSPAEQSSAPSASPSSNGHRAERPVELVK